MAEKSRKELKVERNKKIIIDTAESLFEEYGFERISMDQIADASYFSKTTVYKYFKSKEDIYLALAIRAYSKIIEEFQKELDNEKSGIDLTFNMGMAFFRFFTNYPLYRKALNYTAEKSMHQDKDKDLKSLSKALMVELNLQQQRFIEIWMNAINRGINDNTIKSDFPPQLLAFIIARMTTGFLDELSQSEELLHYFSLSIKEMFEIGLKIIKEGIKIEK